ncbi:glycosyltransferase [Microbacterium sp. cf332]|uniref:glycosyltransferase n=1 Tax=Microbacterium sp. cf332 TaxID=1761804 RepID=UPI00088F1EAD|nr:glycosyltransferase [Microbacterium sp. cf332]SDQ79242.1 Glycosyl transferases group 1 [Microbacterium sp. cf332]
MTTVLRVVLDQLVDVADADTAEASLEVARALLETAPAKCEVAAVVPSDAVDAAGAMVGLTQTARAPFPRTGLLTSWPMGISGGVAGGLLHAPTLLAPLVKHDRAHDNEQTVVTVWDLAVWETPALFPRATVLAHRALLKRAEKHADAVVVPAHAIADRLTQHAPKLAGRIRVIPGAAATGFRVPTDAVGRRRALGVPDRVAVVAGGTEEQVRDVLASIAGEQTASVVVFDEPADVAGAIAAAGIDRDRVIVPGRLDAADRAAVLDAAVIVIALHEGSGFPWRAVEAMVLGVPVVAADSAVHREVLLDGARVAPFAGLRDAAGEVLSSAEELNRWSVRSADRGRAFSWRDHAERVWALHAEL